MADIFLKSTCLISTILYELALKGGTMDSPGGLSDFAAGSSGLTGVSGMANSVCSDFGSQLDAITSGLGGIQSALNGPLGMLRGGLDGLLGQAASPLNDVNSGLDLLKDTASNAIPGIPDVSNIDNLLQNCGILKGNLLGGIQSPESLISDFLSQLGSLLNSSMYDALNGLSGLVEGPVASLISQINSLLNGFGIGDLLSKFDGLFNCIESICGKNFNAPSIPNINSSGFPAVDGYPSLKDLDGFPNISSMTKNLDFNKALDKMKDLSKNKLPDVSSFELIKLDEFPTISDTPGFPYITDMVKNPSFDSALNKIKQAVASNTMTDEVLSVVEISEFPGVESIPGYPELPDMLKTQAFSNAYDEAKKLAQVGQVPYIEYLDESMNYINNMLNDMNLDDEGKFNIGEALADVDISDDIKENIISISDTMEEELEISKTQIAEVAKELETGIETILNPVVKQTSDQGYFA